MGAESAGSVFWRVFGPLCVEVEGVVTELGGGLSGRLLARLLLEPGRAVADSVLTELVWADEWPGDRNALRVVASRARAALGPAGRDLLRRTTAGYQLDVALGQTDHGRFAELVGDGMDRLAGQDPRGALDRFASALSLWNGEPWQGLGDTQSFTAARQRLGQLREMALEEEQAARLALGEVASAVAVLSDLAVAAPFRERRWELLALGLYQAGRQAGALAELRRVRKLLREELGVEPGPALRALEQRILRQDPSLQPSAKPVALVSPKEPPRTPPARAGGIGTPMTSFVGRGGELALLESLLGTARLVTLVGAPGVGKTRLAVEYAATRPDPTWLVRLADAPSGEAVAPTVAAALGVAQADGDITSLIARAIGERDALLVLDNCEHVRKAATALILGLLGECPRLRVLATSRQTLHISGEHTLEVAPLRVRDESGDDGPAVRLLVERVQAGRPGWTPDRADTEACRRICALLDGLPLAIELAAARERALGLPALAEHLRDGLRVLGPTLRGSVTPHASLPAAIAWSLDQLNPAERSLLVRLWPFEGGFTWSAADALRAGLAPAPGDGGLAVLASLVDRSVVTSDLTGGTCRYRLLETVRQYCRELDPDPAATRAAHAAWVRRFVAEQTAPHTAPKAVHDFRALRAELPNIRAGIAHDLAHRPVEALRAAASLEFSWPSLGALTEGLGVVRAALDACPDAPASDRAAGLLALSIGALHAGDPATAVTRADQALDLLDDPDDDTQAVARLKALTYRGGGASELGDAQQLRQTIQRFDAESAHRRVPAWIRANALLNRAGLEILERRWDRAQNTLNTARDLATRCGFGWTAGTADLILARGLIGRPTATTEDTRHAISALHRAMAVFEGQDNVLDALGVLHAGAHALLRLGQTDTAITLHAAVAEHAHRLGTTPARLAHLAGRHAEHALATARAQRDTATLEQAGRDLDWPATVALFHHATTTAAHPDKITRRP